MVSEVKNTTEKIEYESVTVKVPAKIATYYRHQAQDCKSSIEEEMQYAIIDHARSNMEAMSGEDVARALGFGDLFYEILGDERYKPKATVGGETA